MGAFETFYEKRKVQRLLSIARSDNPVLALGVGRRELSWSHFMAWLMDPLYNESAQVFVTALVDIVKGAALFIRRSPRVVDGVCA
jgi:hypothetical protein